jgi:hypothetical protein
MSDDDNAGIGPGSMPLTRTTDPRLVNLPGDVQRQGHDASNQIQDDSDLEEESRVVQQSSTKKPKSPIMGQCKETFPGSGQYYYVVGGKPNLNWTGLDGKPSNRVTGRHTRPTYPDKDIKGLESRTKGITKLEESSKFSPWIKNFVEHLNAHGMDTVSFLPHPGTNKTMISVIKCHSQFRGDMRLTKTLSEQIYPKFDSHDLSNDLAAIEFLKYSVSEELWNEVQLRTSPMDPFVIVYLNLVQLVITTNAANSINSRPSYVLWYHHTFPRKIFLNFLLRLLRFGKH